jgi:FMNH2-dependent dimethyl sulfone monooxygenase
MSAVDHSILDHSLDRDTATVLNGPDRLKLGVFGANLSCGMGGITTHPGRPMAGNWDEMKAIALAADEAGFDALIPVARWSGLGGESRWEDRSLDTFVWGAAVAEATSQIYVFTTCHVPMIHPLIAAKMGATLDHIANGRWGLNIVAGWNRHEFEMFGMTMEGHDKRYEIASEWADVVKRLWTNEGPFDFDGDFYNLAHAISEPQPMQKPLPLIMNAAASPAGQKFAVNHADMLFINLAGISDVKGTVGQAKQRAAEAGRDLAIWGNIQIICRDTEAEAARFVDYLADEVGDVETANRYVAAHVVGSDANTFDAYRADPEVVRSLITTGGQMQIIGTPEQVADQLHTLSTEGVDGLAMAWIDYHEGIAQFAVEISPLLRERGLRSK